MPKLSTLSLFAGLVAFTVMMPPALAQDGMSEFDEETRERAAESAREGLQNFLNALDLLLLSIPRYAPPEVMANGDILIRRLPRESQEAPQKLPEAYGEEGEIDM